LWTFINVGIAEPPPMMQGSARVPHRGGCGEWGLLQEVGELRLCTELGITATAVDPS
jgi:hypothetical protein